MNDASNDKIKPIRSRAKDPSEPVDLKAIYQKVKQRQIENDEAGIIEDNAGISEEIVTVEDDTDIIEDS